MNEPSCKNLGGIAAKGSHHQDIYRCPLKKYCVLKDEGTLGNDRRPIQVCGQNCDAFDPFPQWKDQPGLRVLWLMNDFAQGGLSRYTFDLFKILADEPIQFFVLYEVDFRTDEFLKDRLNHPIRKYSREDFDRLRVGADVITTVGINLFTADREYMLSQSQGKLFSQVHGTCRFSRDLINLNNTHTSEWIAVCNKAQSMLPASANSFVAPYFVDFDRVQRRNDKETAKSALGLAGKRVITVPCRLSPEKAIQETARAVAELPDDVVLLLVGEGWDEENQIQQARETLGDRLIRRTWMDSPTDYLDATDILACLSPDEGGPLTVLEALIHGTVVVSKPVGVLPDLPRQLHIPYTGPQSLLLGLEIAANGPIRGQIEAASELFSHDKVVSFWRERLPAWSTEFTKPMAEPAAKSKRRFAYITGTNRAADCVYMETMIRSARAAGVEEDFHCFAPREIEGGISHTEPFKFDRFMFKFDLMLRMKDSDYDFLIFVDPDHWFVRHPGDFGDMIRDEKLWVSMEGDVTQPKAKKNWWGIGQKGRSLVEVMRSFGCNREKIWNTNAGMFIIRRDAIEEVCREARRIFDALVKQGYKDCTEEPPLAILGQTMVREPERNTVQNHFNAWVSDWIKASTHGGKLPDGKPFRYLDWANGFEIKDINPAIIHVMGNKQLMGQSAQPVGTKLSEILAECGVVRPKNCDCNKWTGLMNQGIEWCQSNRSQIAAHLNSAANQAGWLAMAKVAARGYFTVDSLIDEAIKRATKV